MQCRHALSACNLRQIDLRNSMSIHQRFRLQQQRDLSPVWSLVQPDHARDVGIRNSLLFGFMRLKRERFLC